MVTYHELGKEKQIELAKIKYAKVYDFIIQLKEENSQELSLREIANVLNEAGFKTRQGKEFTAMQVKRILDRTGVPGYSERLENTEKRSSELEKLFERERAKLGKALWEIDALKTENGQLREELENAKVAIRALETERNKQHDLVSMDRLDF